MTKRIIKSIVIAVVKCWICPVRVRVRVRKRRKKKMKKASKCCYYSSFYFLIHQSFHGYIKLNVCVCVSVAVDKIQQQRLHLHTVHIPHYWIYLCLVCRKWMRWGSESVSCIHMACSCRFRDQFYRRYSRNLDRENKSSSFR